MEIDINRRKGYNEISEMSIEEEKWFGVLPGA